MAPINIAAIIVALTSAFLPFVVKALIVVAGYFWATRSSVGFMEALVSADKKMLAVYPVLLFYLFLSWFVLVQ